MYLIDRLEMTHRGIAAREKQLEEVKKVCVPLVRVYSVQRQSLGKMVAKEAIQKKVMTALEMRLEQRQSDLRHVDMAGILWSLQNVVLRWLVLILPHAISKMPEKVRVI